jgi:hypothetical protein
MADGQDHPDRARDRGRDDHGQRRPPLIPDAIDERFPGGEWLDPVAEGVSRALEILDRARVAVALVAGAVVLLTVGAKVERWMMKRQLEVLDGAAAGGEVDLTQGGAGGRRS